MDRIKRIFQGSTQVAILLLLMGLLFAYWMGRVSHLNCVRTDTAAPQCSLRISWLNLFTIQEDGLQELQGAYAQQNCDGDGCTYRVVLTTSAGDKPLTSAYSSGSKSKEQTAQQINQFIADPTQPTLTVKAGGGLIMLVPFSLLGMGAFLFVCSVTRLFRGEPVE